MLKAVILLTFVVNLVIGQEYLIGGTIVPVALVPYQVSVSIKGAHKYGGAIIGNNSILTTAYFANQKLKNVNVRTGSTLRGINGKVYSVLKNIVHPKYNSRTLNYDFAILIVNETIMFNNDTQPAKLPKMDEEVEDEEICQISGWGTARQCMTNMFLREANVTKTTQQYTCRGKPEVSYSKEKICGELPNGSGLCFTDPGTPLTCLGVLQGIASIEECCKSSGFPTVYGRVSKIISWIEKVQEKYRKRRN